MNPAPDHPAPNPKGPAPNPQGPAPSTQGPSARRSYRYYDLLLGAFVTVLLCSNLIGPGKSCALNLGLNIVPSWSADHGLTFASVLVFGAGNIFFPFSYIFGDVLTEVYGYAKSRRVIWAGFGGLIFAAIMGQVVIALPTNQNEEFSRALQPALELCFGAGPRIACASLLAFWIGDFANSYVLAKMKVWTGGRMLWTRTIGSTIVGQGVDSLVFYPLALANIAPLVKLLGMNPESLPKFLQGGWNAQTVLAVVAFNWFFKVMIEVLMTPLTYLIVGYLKRAEGEDYYDRGTDFTPFSLKD